MAILKITVHKTVYYENYFRVRDISGELLLTSRNYSSLPRCIRDIYRLQYYRDFTLEQYCFDGAFHFNLETSRGIIIARSPAYDSKSNFENDIELITLFFHDAEVEDHSTQVRFFRA